ncbi:MAG: hypothetical protein L6N94_01435 [Candidatus Methylarchaceae archaeon HK01M]|nr:hypothetical protein [Candidatus Methylarchaceae archaeon HK01M]
MKLINIELLMGHSIVISESYNRPTDMELLDDCLNASSFLTINQHKADRVRNGNLFLVYLFII